MNHPILLITPPFTQLNTPYPATAYLKGFLNLKNIPSFQTDLGIEVINKIFSTRGMQRLFEKIEKTEQTFSPNAKRILSLKTDYINTVDNVIRFLQDRNSSLADAICRTGFLPEASRFDNLDDLDWAFGLMGVQDKAKHIASLYLDDIADLITECIDPDFGFSRYAERLAIAAKSFDPLYEKLNKPPTYIDDILLRILNTLITQKQPELVAMTIPFPGNLYAALRCGQWIKKHYPKINITLGGGYVNTELRSISDKRIFEFTDFISLDDGEAPLEHLLEYLAGQRGIDRLKRTFHLIDENIAFTDNTQDPDYTLSNTGTPDYQDLDLSKYISSIGTLNPMHRLWSDGAWKKLTMAHGCYWGKCTFCDTSLSYINDYHPVSAKSICDRMEKIIRQTGENGFHFVDEAAPPALMRDIALEILKRKLCVSWWTNIRFEKSFNRELCILLKESGCIAVSGGLEVASDRLLALIKKGVTVSQVAKVCRNFSEAGIMVHAYLMYGFPTQTAQETINSLDMVRQLFSSGVIQSGFWHQFAMTAHSPVGKRPDDYCVIKINNQINNFANNDIQHIDPQGTEHEAFSLGLKKSLFNYMHGIHFDLPLQEWFDFEIPTSTMPETYINNILTEEDSVYFLKPETKIIWLGNPPLIQTCSPQNNRQSLLFHNKSRSFSMTLPAQQSQWLIGILQKTSVNSGNKLRFKDVKENYEKAELDDFESFWYNKPFNELRNFGLLALP